MSWIISVITCCGLLSIARSASLDNCDWTGSGTRQMSPVRGVQPVYLRCNRGTIRWRYPAGALHIVMQHLPSSGEFSACIRRSNSSAGARIYLASRRRLRPVFQDADSPDLVQCVTGDPVTLYVEADPPVEALKRETLEFSYQLKKVAKRAERSLASDCEPCTEQQLLRHYCSSDFVIQGIVTSLFHNRKLQVSELTVRVTKLHQTNGLDGLVAPSNLNTSADLSLPQYVVLHRPLNCGTKSGTGEYLFLGKWELGNPILYCVPRVSEWKKVRRKAVRTGTNECLL